LRAADEELKGKTEAEVTAEFGPPSLIERSGDGAVEYYDGTPVATVKLSFVDGKVVVRKNAVRRRFLLIVGSSNGQPSESSGARLAGRSLSGLRSALVPVVTSALSGTRLADTLLHGGVAPGAPRLNLRYQQARA
jgi:hypothetical protein